VTGTGLVFAGARVLVPGVNVISFLDDPDLHLAIPEDGRRRRPGTRVDKIILHSTRGAPDRDDPRPQTLLPGLGPSTRAGYEVVHDQRHNGKSAGEHLVIDHDRTCYCLADLVRDTTYHATSANERSIGIEYKQGRKQNEFYAEQLAAGVSVVNVITAWLGIQRQIPDRYRGDLARLAVGNDYTGILGHRDQTDDRSSGDPGDFIMDAFGAAGYERHNLHASADRAVWRARQAAIGFPAAQCDGIPGPRTCAALRAQGYAFGLWALPPVQHAA
jgi:hypothetical protein